MRIYRLLGLLSVLAEVEHITVQELAVRFEGIQADDPPRY